MIPLSFEDAKYLSAELRAGGFACLVHKRYGTIDEYGVKIFSMVVADD